MSPERRLNVAMLGTKFMGRAHAHAWRTAGRFFDLPTEPGLRIVAGRDAEATLAFADRWGWEEATTRWRTRCWPRFLTARTSRSSPSSSRRSWRRIAGSTRE